MPGKRGSAGETPRWEHVPCCGGVRGPPTPGGLPPNPQPSLHIRGRGGGPRLRESPQSTRRALATAKAKEPGYSPGPAAQPPICPPNPAVQGAVKIVADHT